MRIDGTAIFNNFTGGLNVASSPYHLPRNQYRDGNNVYLSQIGEIRKRRGRALHNATGLGAAVHSLHRIYIKSNTGFLAGASTTLYRDNALSGTWTSEQTGLTGNVIRGFVYPGDDFFYFCDGTNMYKYNLATVGVMASDVWNWGIAKPTVAPTATPTGAGTFTATSGYLYGYTYYNSSTGHESEQLTSASTGAFTNVASVDVTVTASADAQVTNIRLYRTTDGGNLYKLQGTHANSTATISDSTADGSLGDSYDAAGNDAPAAAKDAIVVHNRVLLVGADMAVQVSQIGEPESFPDTGGYRFTSRHGMGVDIVRAWSYERGTQNAALLFKDKSIIAVYGLYNEAPASWDFRVVDPERGLHSAESLAEGFGRIYFQTLTQGRIKVFEISQQGIRSISKDIEPLLNTSTAVNMAGSVGWFYDGKYFLSFPRESGDSTNTCVMFYDLRTPGWHWYTKDWGVDSVARFDGSGDSGQLYGGDVADGFVDRLDVPDVYGDRTTPYAVSLKTRYDDSGSPPRKKKYWVVTAENFGSDFSVVVRTDRGVDSTHTNDDNVDEIWLGGWQGGWSYVGNKILEEKVEQGVKGRYVTMEFESVSDTVESSIVMGCVDFSVEAET